MNKLVIAFAATMALMSFGCKKKAGGGAGEALAKSAEFKDKMCACKDAECAKKVNEEMTAWSKANPPKDGKAAAMSEADTKKATEIGTEMSACMAKANGAGMAGSGSGDMAGSGSAMAGSGDMAGSGSAAAGSGSAAAGSGDMAGSGSAAAAGSGSAAAGSAAAAGSGEKKEEKK